MKETTDPKVNPIGMQLLIAACETPTIHMQGNQAHPCGYVTLDQYRKLQDLILYPMASPSLTERASLFNTFVALDTKRAASIKAVSRAKIQAEFESKLARVTSDWDQAFNPEGQVVRAIISVLKLAQKPLDRAVTAEDVDVPLTMERVEMLCQRLQTQVNEHDRCYTMDKPTIETTVIPLLRCIYNLHAMVLQLDDSEERVDWMKRWDSQRIWIESYHLWCILGDNIGRANRNPTYNRPLLTILKEWFGNDIISPTFKSPLAGEQP